MMSVYKKIYRLRFRDMRWFFPGIHQQEAWNWIRITSLESDVVENIDLCIFKFIFARFCDTGFQINSNIERKIIARKPLND